jgi:hypothetical protein
MSARAFLSLAALASIAACTGCGISTTTVTVRDTSAVTLDAPDGKPLLPTGAPEAKVAEGSFWEPFQKVDYQIQGVRAPNGALSLRCDACTVQSMDLLEPTGKTRSTWSWRVAIEPENVAVSYEDDCMQRHRHFCDAPTPVRLTIPRDDVVEVRRRIEPFRPMGWLFLGMSALALGSLTYFQAREGKVEPIAMIAAVPFIGFGTFGLFTILTPAKEQVWTPEQDKQP